MDQKLSHSQLKANIDLAAQQVEVGAVYRHYKSSDIYKVIGFGVLEATQEVCVMYQPQNGSKVTFLRPASQWDEDVEWEGSIVKRFTKI